MFGRTSQRISKSASVWATVPSIIPFFWCRCSVRSAELDWFPWHACGVGVGFGFGALLRPADDVFFSLVVSCCNCNCCVYRLPLEARRDKLLGRGAAPRNTRTSLWAPPCFFTCYLQERERAREALSRVWGIECQTRQGDAPPARSLRSCGGFARLCACLC